MTRLPPMTGPAGPTAPRALLLQIRRRPSLGGSLAILAAASAALVGWASWWLMLGVGVVHDDWIPQVPPISFGTAVAVDLTLGTWLLVIVTIGAVAGIRSTDR